MLRTLLSKRLLFPVGVALGLAGCPDPEARYDEFVSRSATERGKGDPDFGRFDPDAGLDDGGMAQRPDPSGTFLFALATELDPGKPLLFKAVVTVDRSADPDWTLQLELTPLRSWCGAAFCADDDATRREELPPPINGGPVPFNEDGTFEIDFGTITAPGGTNAISGAEIIATLNLFGRTQGGTICGAISGALSQPFEFPLMRESNNFGTVVVPEGADLNTLSPIGRCL